MKDLKVLMVIAVFYPYIGGTEKQAQKLALELSRKNVEITVVTGRWSNLLKRKEVINGLKIVRNLTNFNFYNKVNLDTSVDVFNSSVSSNSKILKFLKTLFKKIFTRTSIYIYQISLFTILLRCRKNYNIIHVHQVLFPAFISMICARLFQKPIIVKVGSSGFNSDINQIKKFPEGKYQLKYILRNVNRLVCTSKKMSEEFIIEGIDRKKIVMLHNGVKVNDFNRNFNNCKRLVYLGRFTKTKNIETLIHAFSEIIQNTMQSLELVLIGDGPEKDNIINLIKKLNLEKNILLTGLVEDPVPFLKKSDLFIFPSLVEGLANSLIEAMSYKLPCLVSNIPGNVEVIGEKRLNYNIRRGNFILTKYGILFNPRDIEGLVNSIRFAIDTPDIRRRLGESAYKKVKIEYNIKVVSEKYKKLYKEVLEY